MYSRWHNFEKLKLRCSPTYGVYFNCSYQTQPLEFTKDDAELLFGPDADYKAAFEELDTDEDGEVRRDFYIPMQAETVHVLHRGFRLL